MTRRDVLNRFFIFFTLTVFSFVNVGMAIYTHSCEINGTETSFFLAKEDPCKEVHVAKTPPCCSNKKIEKKKQEDTACHKQKKEDTSYVDKSCCSTKADYITLNIDTNVEKTTIDVILLPDVILSSVYHTTDFIRALPSEVHLFLGDSSPPPLYQGRDLQSIHQVYII